MDRATPHQNARNVGGDSSPGRSRLDKAAASSHCSSQDTRVPRRHGRGPGIGILLDRCETALALASPGLSEGLRCSFGGPTHGGKVLADTSPSLTHNAGAGRRPRFLLLDGSARSENRRACSNNDESAEAFRPDRCLRTVCQLRTDWLGRRARPIDTRDPSPVVARARVWYPPRDLESFDSCPRDARLRAS
jgi:hypothetical protein